MPPKQEDRSAGLGRLPILPAHAGPDAGEPETQSQGRAFGPRPGNPAAHRPGIGPIPGRGRALRAWLNGILAKVIAEAWRKNVAAKRSIDREEVIAKLEDSSGRLEAWLTAKGLAPDVQADRNEQLTDLRGHWKSCRRISATRSSFVIFMNFP